MSPVICNAEYIRGFLKELESKFSFPFRWVDKYTFDGLDVYEEWLDEQKKYVHLKRMIRNEWLEKSKLTDDKNDPI